ncbi:MAG: hypothetical protein IKT46_06275 [Clostridia bacterium]|nr:hypothetical protein [Clostridia bacterium]
MDKKYNIITYKLTRKINPAEVIDRLDSLIEKYNVFFCDCLMNLLVYIIEFEYEGKLYSNRNRNAVKTILKRHPELEQFYKHTAEDRGGGIINETLFIRNFSSEDFACTGEIEYSLISDIAKKVPRPYGVNDLEVVYSGISFDSPDSKSAKICQNRHGYAVGNYIGYCRERAGNEKHSYITFSADDENIELMRKLFFEFADTVPGKYIGTVIQS